MHLKSSDWYKHKHHLDRKYNTVILHVVWYFDKEIRNQNNRLIPCLVLRPIVEKKLLSRYSQLMRQKSWLLSKNQIHQLDLFHISHYLQRLSVDRLEQKTIQFIELFEEVKNH